MFIQKYGKEKFLKVHDKMHETYDFKKTQEILGQDVNAGLKILENSLEKCINKWYILSWMVFERNCTKRKCNNSIIILEWANILVS